MLFPRALGPVLGSARLPASLPGPGSGGEGKNSDKYSINFRCLLMDYLCRCPFTLSLCYPAWAAISCLRLRLLLLSRLGLSLQFITFSLLRRSNPGPLIRNSRNKNRNPQKPIYPNKLPLTSFSITYYRYTHVCRPPCPPPAIPVPESGRGSPRFWGSFG